MNFISDWEFLKVFLNEGVSFFFISSLNWCFAISTPWRNLDIEFDYDIGSSPSPLDLFGILNIDLSFLFYTGNFFLEEEDFWLVLQASLK
jgi:hypothetical protein